MLFASLSTYAIPLGALLVSLVTLTYSATGLRQKNANDLVAQLYDRIEDLERQIVTLDGHIQKSEQRCERLERRTLELEDENLKLMRRVLKVENGG